MKKLELRLQIKETLPKINDSPNDCQDSLSVDLELGRFAVADGVTRSFFPAEWSRLLVEQFCHDTSRSNLDLFKTQNWQNWLSPVQEKWSVLIHDKVSKKTGIDSIHLKNSLVTRDPAASTFSGLQIDTNPKSPTWQAMIIGDSCFFHFTNGKLNRYLLKSSSDFNYRPQYFSSIPSPNNHKPTYLSGKLEIGDILMLTTDALAKWVLVQYEQSGNNWNKTWESLLGIQSRNDLVAFVSNARNNKETPMEDDDVALIMLSFVESKSEHTTDIYEKPSPAKPVFIEKQPEPFVAVASPQAQNLSPTSAMSVKSTRSEKIRREKDNNSDKKAPTPNSALSIMAIIISLTSLAVSLISLFLYYQGSNAVPTIQDSNIVPTEQVAPTPIKFQPTISTLPANFLVYLSQDDKSQILLTTQDNMSVVVSEQNGNWFKVEVELWVLSKSTEPAGFLIQDSLVVTQVSVPAYSAVSINPVAVGMLSQNIILQKIDESSDTIGTWYQVTLQGYVLGR